MPAKVHRCIKNTAFIWTQNGVAALPENYEDRIAEIFAGSFKNLKLFALDSYDIALAKIERNIERDREDVKFLAVNIPFDVKMPEEIYIMELIKPGRKA